MVASFQNHMYIAHTATVCTSYWYGGHCCYGLGIEIAESAVVVHFIHTFHTVCKVEEFVVAVLSSYSMRLSDEYYCNTFNVFVIDYGVDIFHCECWLSNCHTVNNVN